VPGEAAGVGERALVAQDVDEDAITPLVVKALDSLVEDLIVVQGVAPVAVDPPDRDQAHGPGARRSATPFSEPFSG
jgi:hypothetical protein